MHYYLLDDVLLVLPRQMEIEHSAPLDAFVDPSELAQAALPADLEHDNLEKVLLQEESSTFEECMNTRSMRALIDRIHCMKEGEHQQIFRMLQDETTKYTTNLNGVFINLMHLEQKTLYKLLNLVDYFEKQAQRMDESEQMLRHMRENQDATAGSSQAGDPSVPEEVSAYLGTLNLCEAQEESVPNACLQELDHADPSFITVEQANRKRDLALNRAKPKFSGSSARIAQKCQGEILPITCADLC